MGQSERTTEGAAKVLDEPARPAANASERDAHPRPAANASAPWKHRAPLTDLLVYTALGTTLYVFLQIIMFRYGRDQGIYATVADVMLRGGMPYRDAWDFKPPGIFVIYALTRAVFGSGQWGIRVVEVLGLSSVVFAFTLLARRFFGDWRIGVFAGALAAIVHGELEFWHTAQPESFGGMLTVWALVLVTFEPAADDRRARRKQLGAWALAGVLYGAAFLLKPPLGGGAVVSSLFAAAYAARRVSARPLAERLRAAATPILVIAAGSVALVALFALWFVARGAARDLYATLFVFTPHYTKLGWQGATVPGMVYLAFEEWFVDLSSAHAVTVLAAWILASIAPREREGVMHVLGVVAVQLLGVAMQGKFFPYHYGSALVVGSLVAGVGAYKLWQRALDRRWAGVAVFAALLPIVVYARSATRNTATDFFDRCIDRQRQLLGLSDTTRDELDGKLYSVADVSYDADRKVAELLRARLSPDELAYVWGFEPMIYDMADRRSASRYIYNVPQRVAWFQDQARAELMADLAAHPPKAVVVERRDVFPAVTGEVIDSADTLKRFPALDGWLRDGYRLETTIEDFQVYFRKDGGE